MNYFHLFFKNIQTEIFQFQIHHSWLQFGLCFLSKNKYYIESIVYFYINYKKKYLSFYFSKNISVCFFDFAKIKIWIYKCGSKKLDSNSESKIFI